MSDRVVVVGGGLAAGTFVTELRDGGHDGPITLFTDEARPPYERPPLSKDLLLGNATEDDPLVHESAWYTEHDVDVRLGNRVAALDVGSREVRADDGATGYDQLLLATGSRPRRLAMADDSGAPVAYLRTLEDALRLKERLTAGTRIGIVGAGWIGLEVASAARNADAEVIVLETLEQPLLRVVGPEVGAIFARLHREHVRVTRSQVGVGTDAVVDRQPGLSCRLDDRFDADPDHQQVAVQGVAFAQVHEGPASRSLDPGDADAGAQADAVLAVQPREDRSHFGTDYSQ